jgi:predicted HNH restriction endonuclease
MKCINCKKVLKIRSQKKYCSNKCQIDYQQKVYIDSWKKEESSGTRVISTRNISKYIKRYFIEKYGESCMLCSWNKTNLATGKVPLEIDHVDGNSENNSENNLRLICPNCHALTHNFKNLNKGKGRSWRKN